MPGSVQLRRVESIKLWTPVSRNSSVWPELSHKFNAFGQPDSPGIFWGGIHLRRLQILFRREFDKKFNIVLVNDRRPLEA